MWWSGSDQVDDDVDVTACCFGVWASLLCFIHQGLSDVPLHTRQIDVEATSATNSSRDVEP